MTDETTGGRPTPPATPELDKRSKIIETDAHKGIVAFLDWLDSEASGELTLTRWRQGDHVHVYSSGFNRVLCEYYGLDIEAIDREQTALLAYLREINSQ